MEFSLFINEQSYRSRPTDYDGNEDYPLYETLKTLVKFSILVAGQFSEDELVRKEFDKFSFLTR